MGARGRCWVVAGIATLPLLTVSAPAHASCAVGSGPEGSPVVFVGTAEANRRGYTRLAVEEVWRGPDLAPQVWVLSGQEQPPFPLNLGQGVSSSVDADLVEGRRYVVGASSDFATDACSISEVVGPVSRAEGRPAGPRPPVDSGLDGADPPAGPWAIAAAVAVVVALLLALGAVGRGLRRRGSARRSQVAAGTHPVRRPQGRPPS